MSSQTSILVTGGAGFIGSELVRQLSAEGHRVVVLDNLVNGHRSNLEGVQCELVEGDIRDQKLVKKLVGQCELVYHLACLGVRHSLHSPTENHEVNASATLGLLESARRHQLSKFVYVSTSEVYGTARTVPMDESHPTFPMTVYGGSKLAGECYARAYFESFGMPTVVVRPFNSFGPRSHHEGDSGEVIPKFILRGLAGRELIIFGDGEQTRDFTFVSDTARGIIQAGRVDEAVGQTYNLGSNREVTIKELAALVQEVCRLDAAQVVHHDPRPGDVLRLYANSEKALRDLKFEPTVGLREGLQKLLDWYRAQPLSPEELLASEVAHNWKSVDVG